MKKKIFGGIAVLSLVAVAAINMNLGTKNNHLSDVSLKGIEAKADFAEWWDSLVYNCVWDTCSKGFSLGFYSYTAYGIYQKCISGDEAAHCWDCAACDASI